MSMPDLTVDASVELLDRDGGAVRRDLVHDVSPRIPRNAQGKPSLRSWGIALAEVCVPGSNYPLSREEIEQAGSPPRAWGMLQALGASSP